MLFVFARSEIDRRKIAGGDLAVHRHGKSRADKWPVRPRPASGFSRSFSFLLHQKENAERRTSNAEHRIERGNQAV